MTCSQCGAQLAPNSGFCGACGKPTAPHGPAPGFAPTGVPQQGFAAAPAHGYGPGGPQNAPGPHGAPAHGYGPGGPQNAPYGAPPQPYGAPPPHAQPYPPPHAQPYPPPHAQPYPPPHAQPYGGPPPHGQPYPQHGAPPPPYPPHGGQMLLPHPLILQQRMTRLTGQMFVAPGKLFFICESQKGGLAVAIGRGVGGLIGGAIAALAAPTPGQAAPVFDEPTLYRAAQERPGSMVLEPHLIKQIKHTIWSRGIWFDGKTYALPDGFSKELKLALGHWAAAHNVKNAGLL